MANAAYPLGVHSTSPVDEPVITDRHIRSFHARRSRIRPSAKEALERLWPQWGLTIDGDFDFASTFGEADSVVLEIGCGMGDATVAMAANDPSTTILAVDVHTPGLGVLLRDCERQGLTNVRVAECDAVTLLTDHIPVESLAGIRVYFPDPWPKQRQHKRRLIQPPFVELASSRLRVGGTLHCATDWQNYADQMLEVLDAEPTLHNQYGGFAPRPAWRPVTRFERKGLAKDHTINDLVFARV